LLPRSPARAIEARDLLRRHDVLLHIAPREPHKHRVGSDEAERHHPPDVPDQREAGDGAEESGDESGRAVPWELDGFILRFCRQLLRLYRAPLDAPVGLLAVYLREYGEVEGGGRRGRRP